MNKQSLLEYLDKLNRPASISEIIKDNACVKSDQEHMRISRMLQELKRGGRVFRSVEKGHAYYSTDASKGEGSTGTQNFIDQLSSFFAPQEEIPTESGNTLPETSPVYWSFDQNLCMELEEFTIPIPDGFVIVPDKQRGCISVEKGYEDSITNAPIQILPGKMLEMDFEECADLNLVKLFAMYHTYNTLLNMARMSPFMKEKSSVKEFSYGAVGAMQTMTAFSYQILFAIPNGFRMLRIQTSDTPLTEYEKELDAIIAWLEQAKPKQLLETLRVDLPEYTHNPQKLLEAIEQIKENLRLCANAYVKIGIMEKQLTGEDFQPGKDDMIIKKQLLKAQRYAKTRISEIDAALKAVKNPTADLWKKAYQTIDLLFPLEIELDETPVSVPVNPEIKAILKQWKEAETRIYTGEQRETEKQPVEVKPRKDTEGNLHQYRMDALRREASRDLTDFRKDLRTAQLEMGKLGLEMERELRNRIREGMHTSSSFNRDSGINSARVSLTFNANTDSAKAYVEQLPEIAAKAADRLIVQKIQKLDSRLQYYHENGLDLGTFGSLVEHLSEWKKMAANLKINVMSATISLDAGDSLREMERKWRDIAANMGTSHGRATESGFASHQQREQELKQKRDLEFRRKEEEKKHLDEMARRREEALIRKAERENDRKPAFEREREEKLAEFRAKRERLRAQELRRMEAQEAARKAEEEKWQRLQEAHEAWKAQCNAIRQRRNVEFEKQLSVYRSTLEAAADSDLQKKISEANRIIESETKRLQEAESTLQSLGIFSFSQKKLQKRIIEDARSRISSAEKEKEMAKYSNKIALEEINKKINAKKAELQPKLDSEYPLPPEPERPKPPKNASAPSPYAVNPLKQDVYDCIKAGYRTVEEILEVLSETDPDVTTQRISAYIRQLILDGKVEKNILGGKTTFRAFAEK